MARWDEVKIVAGWPLAMLRARALDGQAFQVTVDTMLADIERLSPGAPRSRLAEQLIGLQLGRQQQDAGPDLRCLDRLVRIGDEDSPDRPGWRRTRACARCMAMLRACKDREPLDYRAAKEEVDGLATEFADDPQVRALVSATRATLGLTAGQIDLAVLGPVLTEFGEVIGDNAEAAPLLELMSEYLKAYQTQQNDDSDSALADLLRVMRRSQQLQVPNSVRDAMTETMSVLEHVQLVGASDSDPVDLFDGLAQLQELADGPGIGAERRALYLTVQAAAAARHESDPDRIDVAIADLRRQLTLVSADQPEHLFQLITLALTWFRRSELSGSLADVDEAIAALEPVRELAGGPSHQLWSFANDLLAQLLRRRGDRAGSRRIALEGLRGYTWQVLQQPDPAVARAVAQTAAEEVAALATAFLTDNAAADALRALDAGRGLMLFAATELRDPGARLIDAGRPDLAERWGAEKHPPPWLRSDVLAVLSRDTGLLDPPDLEEIQAALLALGSDALVYLVPADPPVPGWALIVPVAGPASYLGLPNLVIGEGTHIERYLSGLASRDGEFLVTSRDLDPTELEHSELAERVDALCDWAWKAAMGPVVKPYLASDRVPHLVLVPMGELARVPWQAARDPDGRYLVEQVAISQAASARMLCDTAVAEPVRLTSAGLLVVDPDTDGRTGDLPSARLEAYAIRESFYPSATYLGRLPDGRVSRSGSGRPEEVRNWLRADGAAAGAMLHLACHGVIETAPGSASSRLVLAGGDLAADELIGVLADATRHPIGLVILAACHTGRSIHGYDEAYSLATMFLAAGVRSVLSTQWSVPDQATSLLMYMFHHYLVIERHPPREALRRAQVWMLDDGRTAPNGMPAPLCRTLERSDPAQVMAWAGFVHWGQ